MIRVNRPLGEKMDGKDFYSQETRFERRIRCHCGARFITRPWRDDLNNQARLEHKHKRHCEWMDPYYNKE